MLANIKQLVLPYVEKLKRAPLKPKNKTLVEIPGAGHHVQQEKPEELAAVLIPFLNNHR